MLLNAIGLGQAPEKFKLPVGTEEQDGFVLAWNYGTGKYELVENGGGGSYTFENGLTESGGVVMWGGPQTETITINGNNTHYLIFENQYDFEILNSAGKYRMLGDGGFEIKCDGD